MRLRQFHVRGFRCIRDSGLVPIGNLAALIGENENGKTALLQALLHLNKDLPIQELDRCDEMWEEFKQNPQLRIVEGTFELDPDEAKAILEQVPGAPEIRVLKIFRTAEGSVQYEFPDVEFTVRTEFDPAANTLFQQRLQELRLAVEPLKKEAESTPSLADPMKQEELNALFAILGMQDNGKKNDLTEAVGRLKTVVGGQATLLAPTKALEAASKKVFKDIPIKPDVEKLIRDKLHPKFVYFSDYKQIRGAIKIPQYLAAAGTAQDERLESGESLDKRETIDNLFYLAGLDPKRLEAVKNSPALKSKYLAECSERLTKALRPSWLTQPIDIELVYDTGDVLWVRITDVHEDGRRTNKGMLSRRAAGFIWHFSFFVNFTAETRRAELKGTILLLDEPGLHLHPAQQAGTLEVLKELAKTNQIIYTTHSPFMIFDYTVGHLLTVELDHDTHLSTIRATYWDSEPATLIPILHALGAPEAFAGATREMSKRPITIVEGITDYQYLISVQDALTARKPNASAVVSSLNLVPANSSSAIGPLAMYHKTRGRPAVALYDNEPEAQKLAKKLVELGFPEDKIKSIRVEGKLECDVEDLFAEAEYLRAVNELYQEVLKDKRFKPITGADTKTKRDAGPGLVRIVPLLMAIWQEHAALKWGNFDKKRVCDKVCEMIFKDPDFLSEKTLERFEKQFKDLVEALKPTVAGPPAPAEAAAKPQST
ncbi:MAG: AAA family ATPase [Candidatus Acidiferrales bacterium]